MNKLFLMVLIFGQILHTGFADSTGTTAKTNCKNLQPEKPCYDNCTGDIVKYVPSDEECPEGSSEKNTNGNSYIDNLTYSYMHDAIDYSSVSSAKGCEPCGTSSPKGYVVPLELYRLHKFREMSQRGSFGPGVFSNFDIYMTLFQLNGKPAVDVYFAADITNRRYFLQNGKFFDTFTRTSKSLTLYKEDGSETTDFALAKTATVATFKGESFNFEIFQEDETTYKARIISRVDRNNKAISFTYIHAIDSTVDPEDKFKLLTISDANNKTLIFEYLNGKRGGVNVISKVILPNTSEINYIYGSASADEDTNDHLSKVVYPDGTESTFSFEVVGNETLAHIFEAGDEGTHRNKTVHLDNNIVENPNPTRDGQILFNQASLLINQLTIGDGTEAEQAYAIYQNPNGANNRRIFEGGYKLKSINIVSAKYFKQWTKSSDTGSFNDFTGLVGEESSSEGDWKFYSGNAQGRPPLMKNKHGLTHRYLYNEDNQMIKKIYEDGSIERWEYNEFNLKTRHRDRLGRVTHFEFDSRGNLTKKIVGLKAEQSGTAGEEISGLLCQVYDHTNTVLPTNYGSLFPVETVSVPNLELDITDREDTYALLFTGEIEITNAGDYTFFLSSDDGSKLFIDGVEVIDNDGLHGLTELSNEVPVTLDARKHAIRVEFFEKYGDQKLFLKYQGPDSEGTKVTVPDSAYSHTTVEEELSETDVTTPDTAEYNFSYYPAGHTNQFLLHTETDANGNVTEYIYNTDNQITDIKTPTDDGTSQITKSHFTYDSAKRLKTSTDAVGRTTTFEYDSRDRLIKTTYSDLSTEMSFYGTGVDANLLVKKKDRNGNTTKIEYDLHGRAVTTIRAYSIMNDDGTSETVNPTSLQSIEECTYLPGSDLKSSCTIDGELTEYFYDYRNRLIETRKHADNNSILVSKSFFKNNLKQFTEDPYGRRTYFSYRITSNAKSDTAMTRMVKETVPGAVVLNNGYYSEIENLPRILTNNAPYLVTDYINDEEGQVIAKIDPRGIRHEADYDFRGRTTFHINAAETLAQTIQTIYDADSNVIEIRNPRYFSEGINDRTVMTYTARNLAESRTVAAGSTIAATEYFTYYDDGRAKGHMDFRGNTSTKVWKQCCGRLGVVAGPVYTGKDGNQRRTAQVMEYDHFGNLTHSAMLDWDANAALPPCCYPDPLDSATVQETTTKYDSRHRPIASTVWVQPLDTVDPNNVPIAGSAGVSPALGLTTTYEYFDELNGHSELSEIVSELNADGILLGSPGANDAQGSAVIITNPEGEKSVSIMDGSGRTVASGMLSKVDGSLVTWETITHDNVVNNFLETKITSAIGFENKARTDGAGRSINTIDAEGNVSSFFYDNNSNLVSSRDVNGVGEDCIFDDLNRDEQCTDTEGSVVSKGFDLNNNVVVQTDAKNKTTTCIFDERNRKTFCTDRLDAFTAYTYDKNNNLKTITDDKGKTTSYDYDERNLQVKVTYPDHISGQNSGDANYGITECDYDALNRKSVCTDQKGEKVEYLYDLASRLEDRVYYFADDTEESRDEFSYDLASRPLTASKGRYSNIISYTYDEIGRTKTETTTVSGSDYTTTYDYDTDNRLTNCEYPAGNNVVKTFTDRNQIESVSFNAAAIIESTYDAGGREETRTFGENLVTTNTFNLDNTLASKTVSGSTGILPVLGFSYTYDANKN
ncbi:MAG: PA14 domain-containing protein, partial [Lentisphaeraceae bacterium]|nr:PA14 domain-containing protein [Lentisphaeraceae bacterium]